VKQTPYKQGWGRGKASKRRAAGLKSNAFTPYEASGASKRSKHHAKLESCDPLFDPARIDGHGHSYTSARITVPYRGASKSYRFVSPCRASGPSSLPRDIRPAESCNIVSHKFMPAISPMSRGDGPLGRPVQLLTISAWPLVIPLQCCLSASGTSLYAPSRHLGTLGTRGGELVAIKPDSMDFWDDVSRAQIRKSAAVHRAGAGCCLEGRDGRSCYMLVSSACSQAPDLIQCDLFLNGIVVRLVVKDSLASAAGRDAHLPVARQGRTMIGPDPTAARLVVTDSLASAAGRDSFSVLS
jgi:hypothetical protein